MQLGRHERNGKKNDGLKGRNGSIYEDIGANQNVSWTVLFSENSQEQIFKLD